MAKAWSYWYPDLLTHVSGCPLPVVDHELRRVAQVFFESTRAWRVMLPVTAVVADQQWITVAAGTGLELVRVEDAWYDGKPLGIKTSDTLSAEHSGDWTTHTGTPTDIYQFTPGVVGLYPIPLADADTGLKLHLSVRPSDDATGVDDEMAVKFREQILAGAKGRLMAYPDKPWSKPDTAMVHAMAFDSSIGAANLMASRSYGAARIPARPKWC
jgi:hypothetical protein